MMKKPNFLKYFLHSALFLSNFVDMAVIYEEKFASCMQFVISSHSDLYHSRGMFSYSELIPTNSWNCFLLENRKINYWQWNHRINPPSIQNVIKKHGNRRVCSLWWPFVKIWKCITMRTIDLLVCTLDR